MKVICRANTGESLNMRTLTIGNSVRTQFDLEVGRTCLIYGMVVWRGVLHYLVIGTAGGNPSWYPAELFSVVDHMLPSQWHFRCVGEEDGIMAIWGYQELVMSSEHYADLIELEPEALHTFVSRMPLAER